METKAHTMSFRPGTYDNCYWNATHVNELQQLSIVNPASGPSAIRQDLSRLGTLPFYCWLHPELLTERLIETIDTQLGSQPEAIPASERTTRLSEIERELFELEKQEEAIIEDAETIGVELDRRPDADPRVVLAITD